jgi:type IV secretory pathway VirB2 component (pilin)
MKKIIFISLLSILFFGSLAFVAQAQTVDETLSGLDQTAKEVTAFKDKTGDNYQNFLQTKVGQIIGTVLGLVGTIFLILIIYAGITWMTSQGNEQQVTKAKNLLISAIIGIIIVFAAYAITSFLGAELLK